MLKVNAKQAYQIELLNVDIPEISANQVLIKIVRLGICGSDIQVYHGKHKYMSFPVVQGHECSGIIIKTGSDVSEFHRGDHVTVQPQVFCNNCVACKTGNYNVCENLKVYGVHTNGMAVEFFAVDAEKVLKLPKSISFDYGAMTEPVSVAVGTIRRCGEMKGKNVIVLGGGAIGNLVSQVAMQNEANTVIMTDIIDSRLEKGRECGIKYCVNTKRKPLREAIVEYCQGRGADLIIDCAASPFALLEAIDAARPASSIAIVGNYKEPVELELPKLQRRQIDMLGIMMYVREDFQKAIEMIASNRLVLEPLITQHFPLKNFKEAYEYIDNHPNDVMKVMIDVADINGEV